MFPWATTEGLPARDTPERRSLQACRPPAPAGCPEADRHARQPALGAGWGPRATDRSGGPGLSFQPCTARELPEVSVFL